MTKKISKILLSFVFVLGFSSVAFIGTSTTVLADSAKDQVCAGIGAAGDGTGCNTASAAVCAKDATASGCEATSKVKTTVTNVINIFSWVAGVTAVLMVMLGGFWYITSNGDAAKAAKGRTTILYALVGLVIVALAQVIVKFVIGTLL